MHLKTNRRTATVQGGAAGFGSLAGGNGTIVWVQLKPTGTLIIVK
jgi:hypothetical protein